MLASKRASSSQTPRPQCLIREGALDPITRVSVLPAEPSWHGHPGARREDAFPMTSTETQAALPAASAPCLTASHLCRPNWKELFSDWRRKIGPCKGRMLCKKWETVRYCHRESQQGKASIGVSGLESPRLMQGSNETSRQAIC